MAERQRVLVVDDDEAIREMLTEVLEHEGHEVVAADCTEAAKKAVRTHAGFNLAIVDKNLPDESGLEVVRAVREVDPLCVCIMITAFASLESAIEAMELGVYDYLVKPFGGVRELKRKVNQALEHHRLAREKQALVEFLESVTGSMGSGLLVIDADGRLQAANPVARGIFALPDSSTLLGGAGPILRDVVGAQAARAMRTPSLTADGKPRQAEARCFLRDGRSVEIGFTATPMRDSAHRNIGAVITCRDLAGVRALREEENRRQRLEALGEMSARIAHEIRNPLVSIDAVVQLLEEELPAEDDKTRADLKLIRDEVLRLHSIVTDFLGFAQQKPLDLAPVDLASLVGDAVRQVGVQFAEKKVDLTLQASPNPPQARVDVHRMKQVLLNLLLNALDATPAGGTVVASVGEIDGMAWIRVDDTGEGIAEENEEKLFQPFFSTRVRGTGLGLAICASILDAHDGLISLQNREEGGARAEVQLPLWDQPVEDAHA